MSGFFGILNQIKQINKLSIGGMANGESLIYLTKIGTRPVL